MFYSFIRRKRKLIQTHDIFRVMIGNIHQISKFSFCNFFIANEVTYLNIYFLPIFFCDKIYLFFSYSSHIHVPSIFSPCSIYDSFQSTPISRIKTTKKIGSPAMICRIPFFGSFQNLSSFDIVQFYRMYHIC